MKRMSICAPVGLGTINHLGEEGKFQPSVGFNEVDEILRSQTAQ